MILSRYLSALLSLLILSAGSSANNIVFVTNGTFTGNLGGIAGGDDKCRLAAQSAGLPGSYLAWISGSTTTPGARMIHSTSPYQLVNGTIVANNWTDLTDGTLASPIVISETGQDLTQSATAFVWTATLFDSTYFGQNCNATGQLPDWSTTNARTVAGSLTGSNSTWTNAGNLPCTSSFHLYCFQQVPNPAQISGRVLSASGRPITHARIVISGGGLTAPLTYYTNRRGNYASGNLGGATYTVTVSQRRFTFNPSSQNVTLSGSNITNANFTATQ